MILISYVVRRVILQVNSTTVAKYREGVDKLVKDGEQKEQQIIGLKQEIESKSRLLPDQVILEVVPIWNHYILACKAKIESAMTAISMRFQKMLSKLEKALETSQELAAKVIAADEKQDNIFTVCNNREALTCLSRP